VRTVFKKYAYIPVPVGGWRWVWRDEVFVEITLRPDNMLPSLDLFTFYHKDDILVMKLKDDVHVADNHVSLLTCLVMDWLAIITLGVLLWFIYR
jgi:hypothetical protein